MRKYFLVTDPDSMDAQDCVSNILFFVSVFVSTVIHYVNIVLFFCAVDINFSFNDLCVYLASSCFPHF